MKVKCKICGRSIERDEAYKVIQNGKNLYYCSEQEYMNYINEQVKLKKQKDLMYKMVEYFIGKTTNTALFKEINMWLSVADYDTICNYLRDNKVRISSAMRKEFSSEYAKIRYFSAIVKNNINDYKPLQNQVVKKAVDTEVYDIKYVQKKKRKCLTDYEDGE